MKKIILLIVLPMIILFNSACIAMVIDGANDKSPQYVPAEVLVKFREGADPKGVLQSVGIEPMAVERIHIIKPAVTKYKKDYPEAETMTDEEIFNLAYAAMPDVEKSLYRTYKITLPEGMSAEEAVARLKKNPAVEYAEPNRIMRIM